MTTSHLWGANGELWDSNGPLKDFSQVGYHQGDIAVPYHKKTATTGFGPGRHTITDVIRLRSGDVLRGAGKDQTILVFPKSLAQMGYPGSFEWWGGVIRVEGASEVGVEDLTIEFPPHTYRHGRSGQGFNGIYVLDSRDCWIANVRIVNYDVGVLFGGGGNSTADGIELVKNSGGDGAHMDVGMSGAQNNLVTNFRVQRPSIHGLTGNWGAHWHAFSNGVGANGLRMEPNHNGPQSDHFLFSNLQATGGSIRLQRGSGSQRQGGINEGGYSWNVGNEDLTPLDIHAAQLARRLGGSVAPPPPSFPTQTPFLGLPFTIPGIIQAEDFDLGGEGVAYHDTTAGNSGGKYRAERVDIEPCIEGGFNVGWMKAGEWLEYSINVDASRSYAFEARVASKGPGGNFRVEIDGANVSGSISIPDTGGWQVWTTVTRSVQLPAGQHVVGLVVETNGPSSFMGNVNWFSFT